MYTAVYGTVNPVALSLFFAKAKIWKSQLSQGIEPHFRAEVHGRLEAYIRALLEHKPVEDVRNRCADILCSVIDERIGGKLEQLQKRQTESARRNDPKRGPDHSG